MGSSYDSLRTNSTLETKGVEIEYGSIKVLLARAGGSNKRYMKAMERVAKPLRRAQQTGQLSVEKAQERVRQVFSETVILNWWVKGDDGKWKVGVEDPDTGELLKPSAAVYRKVLEREELGELFGWIQEDATAAALYLQEVRTVDAKN